MTRTWTLILVLCCVLIGACADPSPTPDTGVTRTVSDDVSGVTLVTRIEMDEIILADRIWVVDTVSWSGEHVPAFEPRDWEETDWTLIDQTESVPELRNSKYHLERRTLIEPFLPGTYTIPSCVISVVSDEGTDSVVVQNESIEVDVLGVLSDQDSGELNAIPDTGAPPTNEQDKSPALIIVLGSIALVSISILVVILKPRGHRGKSDSALDLLHRVRSDSSMSAREGFSLIGEAFDMLDDRLRDTTEFHQMIRVCDEARYSQARGTKQRVSPQSMATHALELLGDTPHESGARA